MLDKNIKKIFECSDTEISDIPTLNILLCYLLYKISAPVETEHLYDIAIGTGLINYFYYQDSINYLIENELVSRRKNEAGTECFFLEKKGVACAKQLKTYAPKSYRDKLVLAAYRYLTRKKHERDIKIEYIPVDKGYYVRVRCLDFTCDLMDLKLYAPDLAQAQLIGEKIMLNPANFYAKVIELAFSNEEPPYDLTDN